MNWYKYNINDFTPGAYEKWYDLLSEQKKIRIDKMKFTDDKKRSVAGEMLAKTAISQMCVITPEEIIINTSSNGKPYTTNADIHFNISHCEDWVVCAISDTPVGIDIEKIRPINIKIAKRFFSEDEQIYLFQKLPGEEDFTLTPTDDMLKRFFEIWTSKEAYLKFTGEGITQELNSLKINKNALDVHYFDDYIVTIYKES